MNSMQTDAVSSSRALDMAKVFKAAWFAIVSLAIGVETQGQWGWTEWCNNSNDYFDLDGDGTTEAFSWQSTCSYFDGTNGSQITQRQGAGLSPGVGIWRGVNSGSLSFGEELGTTNPPLFSPLSSLDEAYATGMVGFSLPKPNGGIRYGWMSSRARSGYSPDRELEFADGTNQPMALGLPAEPRWLPKLDGRPYATGKPTTNEWQAGLLHRFGQGFRYFNRGVTDLAIGADERLWGIGVAGATGGDSTRVTNVLFSVRQDGSDFREVAVINSTAEVLENEVAVTRAGVVFVRGGTTGRMLYRYDPASGRVSLIASQCTSTPLELADGSLSGTAPSGLFRITNSASLPTTVSLTATGLTNFNRGVVVSPNGWLYVVAQTGGANNGGGIVRCRPDGTEATRWFEFNYSVAPSGASRSRPLLIRDGSLIVTATGPGGYFFRISPDAQIGGGSSTLAWGYCSPNKFEGGWSCESHGQLNRYRAAAAEGDDGFVYGILDSDSGDRFPSAVFRAPVSGQGNVTAEILSQNSLLNRYWNREVGASWVKSASGTLFAGTYRGIVSFHPGKHGVRPIRLFGPSGSDGLKPIGPILRDGTGNLLGIAEGGGLVDEGVIYSVPEDGSGGAVLHAFTGSEGDVMKPSGFLVLGEDGWLYGTSQQGDRHDFTPKLYRLHSGTGELQVVATLPGRFDGDQQPRCGLLRAGNGMLFGTTPRGGSADLGTLFRYDPAAKELQVVHEFGLTVGDIWQAWPELIESRDGFIYGLTQGTGTNQLDSDGVFRIGRDGSGYQVLARLTRRGSSLRLTGGLTEAKDGHLYTVRSLAVAPTTNDTVAAQIIRFVRTANGDEPVGIEVAYENAVGTEPFVAPAGRLVETADGWLAGNSTSYPTAVYRWNPATGVIERIARQGVGPLKEEGGIQHPLAPLLALPDGDYVAAFGPHWMQAAGALRRISLRRSETPVALGEFTFTGTYGRYFYPTFRGGLFSNVFAIASVFNAERVFDNGASAISSYGISGNLSLAGEFRIGVVATDGLLPPALATNWINLRVNPGTLRLNGQNWIKAVGSTDWFPTGGVNGLQNDDRISAEWITMATTNSPAGVYLIEPVLHDPDNRLGNYQVTTNLGSIKLVDPKVRPQLDPAGLVLNFPGIPGKKFIVEQTDSLEKPVWVRTHGFTVLSETPPTVTIPADDTHPTRFVRVTME